jgi:hypothetical protein
MWVHWYQSLRTLGVSLDVSLGAGEFQVLVDHGKYACLIGLYRPTVAALHAIIMVSMRHHLESRALEFVSIATAGLVEAPQVPIWPMAWDEDCDAVLAIVGTAFLLMAPMVIWSGAFHQAFQKRRNQPVFGGWFLLLLIGLICAIVNEVHVDLWTVNQFRFCSAGDTSYGSLSQS